MTNSHCQGCQAELVPASRFCHQCGHPVGAHPTTLPAALPVGTPARVAVLLCCEPHGLPSSGQQTALQQWRDVVQTVVMQVGGVRMQDTQANLPGLMCCLEGVKPEVLRLALRLALSVRDAVSRTWRVSRQDRASGVVALNVGVSLHVVPDSQAGWTPSASVGAQLLHLCQPGHVVVSAEVHSGLTADLPWRDLGRIEVEAPGVPGDLKQPALLQMHGLGPAAEGHRRSWTQRPPPALIGRTSELAVLCKALGRSMDVPGQAWGLVAEAGMGKSLLLAHFLRSAELSQERFHVLSCSPDMTTRERFPLTVWLEDMLGFDPEDEGLERLQKVQARLPWFASRDDAWIVAQFLGVALPAEVTPPKVTPLVAQARLDGLLRRWLVGEGPRQAIVVVEDLHWCDPQTLAFLSTLNAESVLLLMSTREVAKMGVEAAMPGLNWLALQPQDAWEMRQLIARVTKGKALPADLEMLLLDQAAGNPLFLEEFTRGALASGMLVEQAQQWAWAAGAQGHWHPADYRQALVERLDRLGTARSVAMHAAVIGRRFDVNALSALLPKVATTEINQGIGELLGAGMIQAVDRTKGEYEFKHALVQLAAYESVMQRERETMHSRLAAHIESELPDVAERQPALVARHLSQAGDFGRAARRWLAAGQLSVSRSANAEAISYLGEGLSLLKLLPEGERDALELALLTTMGPALIANTGFGSALVGQNFARTRELCDVLADRPEVFPSLWGSWVFSLVRGRLRESRDYALRMRELVATMGPTPLAIEGQWTLGDSLYWMGELAPAEQALQEACQSYDARLHHGHATLFGQDPGVAAWCYVSLVRLHRGKPRESGEALERALAIAQQQDHPFSMSWALAFRHMVAMYQRDAKAALAASEASLRYCQEQGAPFWLASGQIVQGWGMAITGRVVQGLEQMRAGMALYDAIGSNVVQPLWYALLTEVLLVAGEVDAAAEAVAAGMAMATANEECLSEAELWIALGDVGCARATVQGTVDARHAYQRALALTQTMGAVLLENRALQRLNGLPVVAE